MRRRHASWTATALSAVLAAALVGFAALKLLDGHRTEYWPSELVFYGSAALELLAAVLLCTRWPHIGALLACGIFATGGTVSLLWPASRCGCLGEFYELGRNEHLLLSALCGLAAVTVVWLSVRGAADRPAHRHAESASA